MIDVVKINAIYFSFSFLSFRSLHNVTVILWCCYGFFFVSVQSDGISEEADLAFNLSS